MIKNYFLTLAFLLFLYSCSDENTTENPSEVAEISIIATNFLNELIGIMESNSLNRNTIDWSEFRNEVFGVAGPAQSIDEVYNSGAMLRALELLGDNHSFIRRLNGEFISASTAVCPISDIASPDLENIPNNIGYIFITGFSSPNQGEILAFAQDLQNVIAEKDSPEVTGWIVDLRVNTGGNM